MHESTLKGESLLLRVSSLTLYSFNKLDYLVSLLKPGSMWGWWMGRRIAKEMRLIEK